jgi:SAM-dependent methyltransferase
MKTDWDYTKLASHYIKRPDYCPAAIDDLCKLTASAAGATACDIGAGSGHLTKMLLDRGLVVTAVEPNDAMREVGQQVTANRGVNWVVGTGEATGLPDQQFDLVTFGSSFNTTDRRKALAETKRLLKPKGWFACMWNHRDLSDPLQAAVENFIKENIRGYGYGTRREDQTEAINSSGLFRQVHYIEASYVAKIAAEDYLDAWRSHGTLERQAGASFGSIIAGIEEIVRREDRILNVGYTTRIWAAQVK